MAQQFRNPGGIFDIGFAAWHSLDVLRIHDKQFELAFKEIVDWTPIDACTLHRHVRTPRLLEPISQRNTQCLRAEDYGHDPTSTASKVNFAGQGSS